MDLGVAIAAGLAGGYVLTHSRASSSLPGVAIAVALVPPLATVGISLELGATSAAGGALLLFTTNLVAIVLSAMIVMLASGFVPADTRIMVRGRLSAGLAVALLATIGVAVPLTWHTADAINDQGFTRDVISSIREWDPAGRIIELEADIGESSRVGGSRSRLESLSGTGVAARRAPGPKPGHPRRSHGRIPAGATR